MIKLAIDGMGGDFAPKEICKGVIEALNKFDDIEVILFGDKDLMGPYLTQHPRLSIEHTKDYLDMGIENPIAEYRKNKEHSMFKAMDYLALNKVDAVVTAGPTQAVAVGAQFIIKKMDQMRRMAIAPIIPSLDGKGKILLDSGANVELGAPHFVDLAIYASIVANLLLEKENPKIGLINIGSEEGKGRPVDREAYDLLKESSDINFIGNIEPKEIFHTEADVLISDGFTGNIVMKSMEGTAIGLGEILKRELTSSFLSKIGALLMRKQLKRFKKSLDASEIGGAMLFGINGIVIKAHGNSNSHAFYNAIKQARTMVEKDVLNKVKEVLDKKEV